MGREDGEAMSEPKISIPEGMLKACRDCWDDAYAKGHSRWLLGKVLEAALRWLSKNPIAPSGYQFTQLHIACPIPCNRGRDVERGIWMICEWQGRMLLAPEPEVPEAISDLIKFTNPHQKADIIEAYRRGQNTPKKEIR
jgi:hypothetical protein